MSSLQDKDKTVFITWKYSFCIRRTSALRALHRR
ncbi:CRPV-009 [Crowpox virus]|nr:CRPV-009 [Crowpox virus]